MCIVNIEVRNLVKSIREKKGLKQIELAALCGVTPTKIGQIEKGFTSCNQATASKIAKALGKEPSDVFPQFYKMRGW